MTNEQTCAANPNQASYDQRGASAPQEPRFVPVLVQLILASTGRMIGRPVPSSSASTSTVNEHPHNPKVDDSIPPRVSKKNSGVHGNLGIGFTGFCTDWAHLLLTARYCRLLHWRRKLLQRIAIDFFQWFVEPKAGAESRWSVCQFHHFHLRINNLQKKLTSGSDDALTAISYNYL